MTDPQHQALPQHTPHNTATSKPKRLPSRLASAVVQGAMQMVPLWVTVLLAAVSYAYALKSEVYWLAQQRPKNPNVSDHYLRHFAIQSIDLKAQRYTILKSHSAERLPATETWTIETPLMEQYTLTGERLEAKAMQADYREPLETIELRGQVQVVHTGSQATGQVRTQLQTQWLSIDNAKGVLQTPKPISVARPGQQFNAQGIEYASRTGNLKTLGPVQWVSQ